MSDKVRVFEVAEEAGTTSKDVIEKAKEIGINVKAATSGMSVDEADKLLDYILSGVKKEVQVKDTKEKIETKVKKESVKKEKKVKKDKEDSKEEKTNKKLKKEKETKKEDKSVKKVLRRKLKKVSDKNEDDAKEENQTKEIKKDDKIDVTNVIKEDKIKELLNVSKEIKNVQEKDELKDENKEKENEEANKKKIKKIKPVLKRREKPIIIKKKNKVEEKEEEIKKTPKVSLSSILNSSDEEKDIKKEAPKKEKKEKKKKIATKKNNFKQLEIEKDFTESSDSLVEEVEMIDIHSTEDMLSEVIEKEEPKKQTTIRTTKNTTYNQSPVRRKKSKKPKKTKKDNNEEVKEITISSEVRVYEFAQKCNKSTSEVISVLFSLGMAVTKNDFLNEEEIEILAEEFGIKVNIQNELEELSYVEENEGENIVTRAPVVTIMGHVDHGKTSLLDKIRNSKIAQREAGGITQHIGAYMVEHNGEKITFIDTPGHEAFSSIRARGASVTDIVIIVVAADDGVKPQTKEAISHAKNSGCPIIVAVNKIDKPNANIDMVKTQMAENDMLAVDWGGEYEFIPVSAKTGDGIDDLLETILLQAEILELKASLDAQVKSTVIESSLAKGRGPVATIIMQQGILRVGDSIVADTTYGKVRAITNDKGQNVKELYPSETAQILGLNEVPPTGSILANFKNEKEAKEIATKRAEYARLKELSKSTKVSLEEMSNLIAEGKIKQLPVIIKADAGGSLEAIKGSLEKIKNDEVKVKIIHSAIGGITENDIILANSGETKAIILGFNVRPTGSVKNRAKKDGITINTYTVIYDLIDDVKEALSGMMSKKIREENTGQAEVRETFVIPKVGVVAGCMVTDGKVIKGEKARIIRDGVIVYTGKISSLKRFKDDVKEVANGFECGIMFENFNDIKVGDFIETFIEHEEKRSID